MASTVMITRLTLKLCAISATGSQSTSRRLMASWCVSEESGAPERIRTSLPSEGISSGLRRVAMTCYSHVTFRNYMRIPTRSLGFTFVQT